MKSQTETIRIKVDSELKAAAEAVLRELGLSLNMAINIFLRQIVFHNGLPFKIEKYPKTMQDKVKDGDKK